MALPPLTVRSEKSHRPRMRCHDFGKPQGLSYRRTQNTTANHEAFLVSWWGRHSRYYVQVKNRTDPISRSDPLNSVIGSENGEFTTVLYWVTFYAYLFVQYFSFRCPGHCSTLLIKSNFDHNLRFDLAPQLFRFYTIQGAKRSKTDE